MAVPVIATCEATGCTEPATVLVRLLDDVPGLPPELLVCDDHAGPVLSGLWNNYLTRATEVRL